MSTSKFLKKLTAAEVGNTKTHEIYIRIPNDFDFESFFNNSQEENGSVIEVNFKASVSSQKDITLTPQIYDLRFVYFANSNKEKRIPGLGLLFKSYNVEEGDVVCLEKCSNSDIYNLVFLSPDVLQLYNGGLLLNGNIDQSPQLSKITKSPQPLQQIVFGAPGTGKSHGINSNANISESNSIRTTFHPDSDYSSFVGCYKPTKREKYSNLIPSNKLIAEAKNISGVANQVKYLCDNADSLINAANELNISLNKLIWESFGWHNETYFASFLELIQKERADFGGEITYEFCPQAFTNAYVNAWKNLEEPYYLIIEEINRGNCAQIFGDIFQLLDRDENGFSSYKITPDQDLAHYLRSQFKDSDIDDEDIKSGCKMQLPNNLHIWATMNTSDQSLFPIDSAFKRRWDWKYMPIDYTDLGHYISCEDKKYSWSDFLEKVNEHIEATTQSEDKKLGYWFLARKNHNEITTELFVSKVIFYLWNDIFKDFASAGNSIFKDEYSKFHKFFDYSGNAKSDVVKKFLDNLGVSFTSNEEDSDNSANNDTVEAEA